MKSHIAKHAFSVEMKSKNHIKQISLSSKSGYPILFEGILGELKNLSLVEDLVLEIKGKNGILRIDLTKDEIRQLFEKNPKKLR